MPLLSSTGELWRRVFIKCSGTRRLWSEPLKGRLENMSPEGVTSMLPIPAAAAAPPPLLLVEWDITALARGDTRMLCVDTVVAPWELELSGSGTFTESRELARLLSNKELSRFRLPFTFSLPASQKVKKNYEITHIENLFRDWHSTAKQINALYRSVSLRT